MITLTDKQVVAIGRLLAKLSEKSTVVGVLIGVAGAFGVADTGWLEKAGGGLAIAAGVLFTFFNDATVRSWFIRSAPIPVEAMEPEPATISNDAAAAAILQELPVSFLSSGLSIFSKLTPIVTAAVQVVETVAPNAPGVEKFEKAKAGVAAAVEKASDIKENASDLWDVIEPLIELVVAALKPAPTKAAPAAGEPAPGSFVTVQ